VHSVTYTSRLSPTRLLLTADACGSQERTSKQTIVLLKAADNTGKVFNVFRPNTGRQGRIDKLSSLLKKYEPASVDEAKKWWCVQYESSLDTCCHAYW